MFSPFFSKAFDKFSFVDLTANDLEMLKGCVQMYKQYCASELKHVTNPVIFDVGCNAGSFVQALNNHQLIESSKIHCFEPNPYLAKEVTITFPEVLMHTYCLSDSNNSVTMHFPQYSVGLSSIIERSVFKTLDQEILKIEVPSKTIDTFCLENNIDTIHMIKIDVEGAEKMVLDGARHMLENHNIWCGVFEVGQTLADAGTSEQEICNFLQHLGYTCEKIDDNNVFFKLTE